MVAEIAPAKQRPRSRQRVAQSGRCAPRRVPPARRPLVPGLEAVGWLGSWAPR